jgi:cobalt/nickel transport system permease protein
MHGFDEFIACETPERQNLLASRDVRVTLAVALAAILAVVLSTRLWLPLGMAACCAIMLMARMPLRQVAWRLTAPLAIAVLVCLLQGVMTGKTPLVELTVGAWRLALTREGMASGTLLGSRVLGSMSVIFVLCLAAPAHEIFAALRWAKMPRTWVEIGMLMYRYTFTLFDQADSAMSAQRVRLGYATAGRSLRSLGSLAGIVALRSIDQAERTHEAMLARGYHGPLPCPRLRPLRRRDALVMLAAVAAIGLLLLALERWL